MNNLNSIQEAYFIDGVPYSDLPQTQKDIIDIAADKLKEWEFVILSYNDNPFINIGTKHPTYPLLIRTDFPDDLSGKMLYAYTSTKDEFIKSNSL